MSKDIEYKGINYQDLKDEVQLKSKVEKCIPNNDNEIKEIQKEIRNQERKKEVTLSVNAPGALLFPSVLAGVLAGVLTSYIGENDILLIVISVSVYLFLIVYIYVMKTNKLIKKYNNKIDLCEEIKSILQREDDVMENEVNEKNITNIEKEKVLSTVKIENTCIREYLEIVKEEYQIERGKRQSFESRAGIIITILTALCIFMFDKIQMSNIIGLMAQEQCSFFDFLQIITGVVAYGGFMVALLYALKTITIRKYSNFNVAAIREERMAKPVIEGCIELVNSYKSIIINHRDENEKSAKYLKKSYISIFVSIIAIIIYVNI